MALAPSKIIGNRIRAFATSIVEFRAALDLVPLDGLAEKIAAIPTTPEGKITGTKYTPAQVMVLANLAETLDADLPQNLVNAIVEAL